KIDYLIIYLSPYFEGVKSPLFAEPRQYLLDWKDFVAELKKKKLELSGKLKDEWFDRFKRKKEEALEIKRVIDRTDAEIDIMVYKLYELTFEEVKIIDSEFEISKHEYDGYEIAEE
ncbi:MAG: hypothetical protein KDK90_25840, partial [Leptospiraceae bacterium]|nr:hypothetical protein [Leptospiraceae bacterium]